MKRVLLLLALIFTINTMFSQTTGDFRSSGNGDWDLNSSWQVYNGSGWSAASSYPGENAGTYAITVQIGHTITVIPDLTTLQMGDLTINGTLILGDGSNAGNQKSVTLLTNQITIGSTGILNFDNNKIRLTLPNPNAVIIVLNGGSITSTPCNSNKEIYIGNSLYAVCNGSGGYSFGEVVTGGGSINAEITVPSNNPIDLCIGSTLNLSGRFNGSETNVTYQWKVNGATINSGTLANNTSVTSTTYTPPTIGQYLVEFIVTSGGFTNVETRTIYVNSAPTITNISSDISVTNDTGQCGANVTYVDAEATGEPATITYSQASGTFFPVGTTTVTVTATNSCGSDDASFEVTVADTELPTINCENINATTDLGQCTVDLTIAPPIVSDNCQTGNGLRFDGVDDFVSIGAVGNAQTIEFWMYSDTSIDGNGDYDMVFNFNNSDLIYIATNGVTSSITGETISVVTAGGGGILSIKDVLPAGWNHIAITGNGTVYNSIYLNGNASTTFSAGGNTNVINVSSAFMGQRPSSPQNRFEGALDEVRFWNTSRTASQIQSNLNNELGTQPGLIGLYNLNEGVAYSNNVGVDVASDTSGNGNNGTLNNFALTGCSSNWVPGFNGIVLTNDFNNSCSASGNYPIGETTITWTATDASGNQVTCEQLIVVESPLPVLVDVNPNPFSPGDQVVINGNYFTDTDNVVTMAGVNAPIVSQSVTSITVTTPADICSGDIIVTNACGLESNALAYTVNPPVINAFTPNNLLTTGNQVITLDGTDFNSNSTVTIGGQVGLSVIVIDANTLTFISPADLCDGSIEVTSCGQVSNSLSYTMENPTITVINPSILPYPGNVEVVINGTGFSSSGNTVTFDGISGLNIQNESATSITVTSPAGLCSGNIVVTNACGVSSTPIGFTVIAPNIVGIDASPVVPGTSLTINGTNFNPGQNSVTINGVNAPISSETFDEIVVTVPDLNNACDAEIVVTTCSLVSSAFSSPASELELPTISCPSNINAVATSAAGAVVTFTAPVGADNCGVASTNLMTSLDSGDTFPIGDTVVTYQTTDTSGNVASCSFTVSVVGVAPNIVCPANITQNSDAGLCSAIVDFIATDAVGIPESTITYSQDPGTEFSVGTTTVVVTATNAVGTSTCSFEVTVNDTENPVVSCPADITVSNDPGSCDAVVTFSTSFTDNCAGGSVVASPASGSTFALGTTTVTVTATDAAGNEDVCTFEVTVNDTENPVVSCPADITVSNDPGSCDAVVTFSTSFTDNCAGGSVVASPASGSTFALGTTTVTVTATDAAGNEDVCTFEVTVNDTENPVVSCPSDIIVSNDPGSCDAVVTFSTSFTDNCAGGSVVASPASGSVFALGTTTVTVTATDAAGNEDVCTFEVTVNDTENPVVSCPADITVSNDPGSCDAVVTFSTSFTDNCAGGSVVASPASGSTFALGTTTVTVTATDAAGNEDVCTFEVTVNDTENPVVSCPSDIIVSNDPGSCDAVVTFSTSFTDNCAGGSVVASPASGSTFALGTTTVTVTATDAAGNTDICTFEVTVNDTENPVVTCPGDISVSNDLGDCGAIVNFEATATDNCSTFGGGGTAPSSPMVISGVFDGPLTGGIPKVIEFYVISDIADLSLYGFGSANNGGGTDGQEYTFSGSANAGDRIYIASESTGFNSYFGFNPTGTSGAAGINGDDAIELFYNGSVIDVFGDINVDGSGQAWDYEDGWAYRSNNTGPDGSTFIIGNWIFSGANATDGCTTNASCSSVFPIGTYTNSSGGGSGGTIAYSHQPGDFFPVGTTEVTVTATDAAGNTDVCTFDIVVTDNENPTIVCIGNQAKDTDLGQCDYTVNGSEFDPTAFDDNCPGSTISNDYDNTSSLAGSVFPIGTTTVVWTVTDASGNNTATCSFDVVVSDNEAPVVVCLADIAVSNDSGDCGAIVNFEATATDNCSTFGGGGSAPSTLLVISGVIDGPLGGGTPKAIELYAIEAIADLSIYGVGSANNGGASSGVDFSLSGSAAAGEYIYVASESIEFNNFFGFNPDFTDSVASINGDDVIELFENGTVIDVFGVLGEDGTGKPWEYLDGWAYRNANTGPDGSTFELSSWSFSGPNALDGETSNGTASSPFPIGTYSNSSGGGSGGTIAYSHQPGDFFPVGTTEVTVTATDAAGNTDVCTFDIVVTDDEDPTIACIGNQAKDTDLGQCDYTVNGSEFDPTAFDDNCLGSTISNDYNNTSSLAGSVFPIGTTTVVWTVTDASGNNTATCSFDVVVSDNEAPVVSCPSDIAVSNDLGDCGGIVNFEATATDNCSTFGGGGSAPSAPLVISGVIDGPLAGGTPKAIELYAIEAIADLSIYGVGSANNGGASSGVDFSLSGSAAAGEYIYVASESIQFNNFFGFNPDFTDSVASINGDDVIELFENGTVIDVFGVLGEDGTGKPWEYLDGWAYRNANTGPDGSTFELSSWSFSGPNALDGETSNGTASSPFPIGTYSNSSGGGSGGTIAYSHQPGDFFPVGTTEVTVTATDAAGNTDVCTFDIVVTDDEDPAFACPVPNVSYTADQGLCSASLDFSVIATDNCEVLSTVYSVDGSVITYPYAFPVGTTQVDVLVTDIHNNTSDCSFDVVVTDDEDPIFACPVPNASYTADAGLCSASLDFSITVTDNCEVLSTVYSVGGSVITYPYAFPVGTTQVDILVTDIHNNTSDCSFDVVVTDDEYPVFTCPVPDASYTADAGLCSASLDFNVTATDNCGVLSTVYSVGGSVITYPYDFPVGTTQVDILVTDIHNNTSDCSFDVVVTDDEDPIFACPVPNASYTADAGLCSASLDFSVTATDNCEVLSTVYSVGGSVITYPYEFPVGTTQVDILVTDIHNNTSDCSFNVVVTDDEDPIFACPTPAVSYTADAGLCSASLDFSVTATDNCEVLSTVYSVGGSVITYPFDFPVGTTQVDILVTDIHNNTSDCSFDVVVTDDEDPIFACPVPDASYTADAGLCSASLDFSITATDNCEVLSTVYSVGGSEITYPYAFLVGTTQVDILVTDIHNNTSDCSFDVVVTDDEDPAFACPVPDASYTADGGLCSASLDFSITATDNCEVLSTVYSVGGSVITYPYAFPVGTTQVDILVTDIHNNTSDCSFDVVVTDDEAPIVNCLDLQIQLDEYGNGSIELSDIDGNSTDNCEIASITLSQETFDCSDIGGDLDSLIISEYVDGTQNDCIEIYNGTGNPVNMVADNYRLRIYTNGALATYDFELAGIIPNDDVFVICFDGSIGVNSSVVDQTDDFEFDGNDAVALVKDGNAVDVVGVIGVNPPNGWSSGGVSTNGTTLIRNIDVLQANINTFVANLATEWSQFPQDTYGNLGTHDIEITDLANNVILTVTDIHGNVSTCEGNVTVVDATPPVALCQSITVALLEDGTVSVNPSQIDNGSMDACGIATLQLDVTDFNCSNVGDNPVVLTVTDVNGNSSTCNATVTIIDTTPPVVATQDITVQLGGDGTVSISPEDVDNNTMDVCSAVTLAVSPNTFDCDNIGENTVTLTSTDIYGNSSSATAIVTVEDVYDPTAVCNAISVYLNADGSYTLSDSDIEAIAEGSFDNCDDELELSVSPMTFDCENRGDNTVTLTVTDNYGNSDTCTATVTVDGSFIEDIVITASELPEFCQGAAIVLTANAVVSAGSIDNTVTYLWDTNETTQSIEVTANGTYGVQVTSSTNCSEHMEITISDFDAGSLVAAYTILAENEVYLHGSNLVQSGGVGSMNPTNGNVKLHQATNVSGFVQSVSLDLNQGSTVGSWNPTAANPTIPQFVYNTQSNNSSPSVTINNNQTQTLNGSVYKTITVKQGATLYFSQSNVYINELKTFEGASIEFNTCANVFINEKFMLAQGGTINADDSNKVIFFVNEDVQIEKGSDVRASIHANTHELMVKGDNANGNQVAQPTYMRGLFIANKVHGNKNVIWNADDLCDPCPISAPATGGGTNPNETLGSRLSIEVEAWPNPSDSDINLRLKTKNLKDQVEVTVFDMNNRLVHKGTFHPENVYKFGSNLDGGVYLVKVSQAGKLVYTRVVRY